MEKIQVISANSSVRLYIATCNCMLWYLLFCLQEYRWPGSYFFKEYRIHNLIRSRSNLYEIITGYSTGASKCPEKIRNKKVIISCWLQLACHPFYLHQQTVSGSMVQINHLPYAVLLAGNSWNHHTIHGSINCYG